MSARIIVLAAIPVIALAASGTGGRDAGAVGPGIEIGPAAAHPPPVAQTAATTGTQSLVDYLIPDDPAYDRLWAALEWYHTIAAQGGWESVPAGKALALGSVDPRVTALRRRLAATGDLPADRDTQSPVFDLEVEIAVRRFQERHGIGADAIVGRETLSTLNVPVEDRILQLEENLVRLRQPEFRFGDRAVVVNIAAAELVVIDGGREVLRSRTIVGQPDWQTPRLTSAISTIEINPTWSVPRRIAAEELVPAVRERGFDHFQRQGFRLFDWSSRELDVGTVDWASIDSTRLPFILRQDPGPGNALGHVKFLFPNRHSVYLHDTPTRSLFSRPYRALSHGCVRVEAAEALALYLLKDQPGWDAAAYRAAVARGRTQRIRLDNPFPLHIVNLTAWAEPDGRIQFRIDPYAPGPGLQMAG